MGESRDVAVWLKTRGRTEPSGHLLEDFSDVELAPVRAYHRTLPGYEPTPLVELPALARELGVETVAVKDESSRLGLGAFKALGAAWAVHRLRAEQGLDGYVTATDGNHGRAVAWAAAAAGGRAVVYLPTAASEARARAMEELGAEVRRVDGTYDDAVDAAARCADAEGLALVQDMAWPGYETVPRWIVQGYTTLIDETLEQSERVPTHVLIPCGVGSFAASVVGRLAWRYGSERPRCLLVEPLSAACALAAFEADTDEPPLLEGDTHGFMACLSCGRLSHGAWPLLRSFADGVVAIPDAFAVAGMRRLAAGAGDDPVVASGESGAATVGLLHAIASGQAGRLRETLGLESGSRILSISTEGATDPEIYRQVVAGDLD